MTQFKPISFHDFPLLYILGIVDTIDPMKLYRRDHFTPDEILKNLQLDFKDNTIQFKNGARSELDFTKLIDQAKGLEGWLDVESGYNENQLWLKLK